MVSDELKKMKSNSSIEFERIRNTISEKKENKKPKSSSINDERFWQPTTNKLGNGSAVIRFLPASKNEDIEFVEIREHYFKSPITGKVFYENCPGTIGLKCPICAANKISWNEDSDENSPGKRDARIRKIRTQFISNIYVIEDKAKPENEGRVFLYKYGQTIYDKIEGLMFPKNNRIKKINPFDFWDGADFCLTVAKEDGFINYKHSVFTESCALFDNDEDIEAIWSQQHLLQQFIANDNFKPFKVLESMFHKVWFQGDTSDDDVTDIESIVIDKDKEKETIKHTSRTRPSPKVSVSVTKSDNDDDDDIIKVEDAIRPNNKMKPVATKTSQTSSNKQEEDDDYEDDIDDKLRSLLEDD